MKTHVLCSATAALLTLLFGASFAADVPDTFLMNLRAYEGVTFQRMFAEVEAGEGGITFGKLIDMLRVNTDEYIVDPTTPDASANAAIGILKTLEDLKRFLDTPANAKLKARPVREFLLKNLATEYKELFGKYLDPLEQDGLTFPFVVAAHADPPIYDKITDLLNESTGFVSHLGKMCYKDFWTIGMDSPLMDDCNIAFTHRALECLLFGALPVHWANYCVAEFGRGKHTQIRLDSLEKDIRDRGNDMCCDRVTRTCRSKVGYNCPICYPLTNGCCPVAQWCPQTKQENP